MARKRKSPKEGESGEKEKAKKRSKKLSRTRWEKKRRREVKEVKVWIQAHPRLIKEVKVDDQIRVCELLAHFFSQSKTCMFYASMNLFRIVRDGVFLSWQRSLRDVADQFGEPLLLQVEQWNSQTFMFEPISKSLFPIFCSEFPPE